MGCGKSTHGKKLALKLGYDFIDLDHQIERELGTTITAFFAQSGEEAFRKLESDRLKNYDYPQNCVVATGGGAPCFFDNMDWMNENGLAIYIQMTPLALARRLEHGKEKRPLLKDLDEAGLVDFITQKLAEREADYSRAELIVNGINLTADDLRAAVLSHS